MIILWQCEDEHDWRVHGAAEEAAGGGGRQEEGPCHEERCHRQAPLLFTDFFSQNMPKQKSSCFCLVISKTFLSMFMTLPD
jgi:hypothetical protein